MEGFGFHKYANGQKYMGQFHSDKREGYGIYYWDDGRVYSGYWRRGKQHGLGCYIVPDKNKKQKGLWENGKRIEWFTEEQIEQINNLEYDYSYHFKNVDSRESY